MGGEVGSIGRTLILLGIVLIVVGGLFLLGGKIPWLGKLPGDIYIRRDSVRFYFPLMTSILLSILLTLILNLFSRR
ncbi:MAG: DUF2905 domain-containing protein [Candidatus Tectomicrobia bacterium]|uniref:DUF2905 domain-containing protein n=1 Tax=Tectimicrobiota bacterium TaxID=2528274 RepID=A0A932FW79_UNCTE|nr:DUF2905 domain-containing protein [Candidatus Tectomicrobia bacterium]